MRRPRLVANLRSVRAPAVGSATWRGVPVADLALAGVLLGLAAADAATTGYGGAWLALGATVAALAAAAAALRTVRPVVAAASLCLLLLVCAVLPSPHTPLWGFVLLLLVSFSVSAHLGGRARGAALLAIVVSSYPLSIRAGGSPGDKLVSPVVIVGAAALAGVLVRRSRLQAQELATLAETLRAERAEHARLVALAERARIARDVHDVVAHTVSLMVVQAGAAMSLLAESAPAHAQLASVRATGREALRELHGLLTVLRDGGEEPALAQPGIDELIELARGAGVDVQVRGVPRDVGAGVALTAYQVAREALTNARRHAPGAPVKVEVTYDDAALNVHVTDSGPGAPNDGAGGHGITGMRERAALYSGEVTAGARPGGGWEVRLRLPTTTVDDRDELASA